MSTYHLSTIKPFFNEDSNTFIYGYISAVDGHVYLDIKGKGTEGTTNEVTLFNDPLSAFGLINNIHSSQEEASSVLGTFTLPVTGSLKTSSTLTYNIDIDEYLLAFLIPYQYTVTTTPAASATYNVPITYYFTFRYVNDGLQFIDTSYNLPDLANVLTSEYVEPVLELEARYDDLSGGSTVTYSSTALKIPNYSKVIFNCLSAAASNDIVRSVEYHFGDSTVPQPVADRIESRIPLSKVIDTIPKNIDRVVFDTNDNADITNPLRRVIYHTYSLPKSVKNIPHVWVKVYTFNNPSHPYIYNYELKVKPQNVYDMFSGLNIINANLLYDVDTGIKSINLIYETVDPRYITYTSIDRVNSTFTESITEEWSNEISTPSNGIIVEGGVSHILLEDGNYILFELGT